MVNLRLSLYQPDIPQNCGAAIRLAACLGVGLDLIEPFGFIWDAPRVRRVAMDYFDLCNPARHASWEKFHADANATNKRLVILSTKAAVPYTDFNFRENDVLLMGRESAGLPDAIHASIPHRLVIPMAANARSLNVITAAAIVLGEALRQLNKSHRTPA